MTLVVVRCGLPGCDETVEMRDGRKYCCTDHQQQHHQLRRREPTDRWSLEPLPLPSWHDGNQPVFPLAEPSAYSQPEYGSERTPFDTALRRRRWMVLALTAAGLCAAVIGWAASLPQWSQEDVQAEAPAAVVPVSDAEWAQTIEIAISMTSNQIDALEGALRSWGLRASLADEPPAEVKRALAHRAFLAQQQAAMTDDLQTYKQMRDLETRLIWLDDRVRELAGLQREHQASSSTADSLTAQLKARTQQRAALRAQVQDAKEAVARARSRYPASESTASVLAGLNTLILEQSHHGS